MNRPPSHPNATQPKLNAAAIEQARGFLSSLFLGLRTAQTHEFSNRAFENATRLVYQSASQLYTSTGGFSIQFGETAALLNGQRLWLDGAEQAVAALKSLLESGGMGGIEMRNPPTEAGMRKLILLFCNTPAKRTSREDVIRSQRADKTDDLDARLFRSYAKLVLALRGEPVRVQRALQDLVEIGFEHPDELLHLSMNDRGGSPAELHGVNSALVALVLGAALALAREDLVQLGWSALFHHVGPGSNRVSELGRVESNDSISRLAAGSPVGRNTYLRIAVVGERCEPMPRESSDGAPVPRPHLFSRITAVAVRFRQLVGGFGTAENRRLSPMEAIARMTGEESVAFDPQILDLLVNVLRVFPVGTEVVFDSGELGLVSSLGERWDRPSVRAEYDQEQRTIDLGAEPAASLAGTRAFMGSGDRITLDELERPRIFDEAQLAEMGVAPIELIAAPREGITDPPEMLPEISSSEVEPIPLPFATEPLAAESADSSSATQIDGVELIESIPPEPLTVTSAVPALVADDTAISEIGELKERLERRRKREAERGRARRVSRIEHLAAQIAGYRAEREELAEEANSLDEDARAAARLAETVVQRQSDVERTLSEIDPAIGELEGSLEEMWSKREDLSTQANDLDQRAMAARADARDAEEKAEEAEAEARERGERIAELEAELYVLRAEQGDLERAADTFRNAAEEEKRIAAEAEATAETIRRDTQAKLPELTGNEEKLEAMRERRMKLQAEKTALEQSAENAKSIAAEARSRVDEARARIAEADDALATLERELEQLRAGS